MKALQAIGFGWRAFRHLIGWGVRLAFVLAVLGFALWLVREIADGRTEILAAAAAVAVLAVASMFGPALGWHVWRNGR